MADPEQILADQEARKPIPPPGDNPPTLRADVPAIPTPLNPDYKPSTKDEAKTNISLAQDRFDEWKKSRLAEGVPVKISDGEVYRWEEQSAGPKPDGWTDEEWQAFAGGGSGKWVLDTDGQLLLDEVDYAERLAKELSGSAGAARSALQIESDKTSEITRQYKDFASRASLLYDLMDKEQEYGMNADDQNIANWKAQRDLGMATNPGGYYATPYQSMTMSDILRPSLPDYVRPDYRLNQVVGLPGPQGFDDPDYTPYGLPAFATGTNPVPPPGMLARPTPPPGFWPWKPRL